ncbi:glycosyltransferase family 2 protein [Actinokineospora pegani]|uniref:glycosyltransferase family 2 protein n=1 Tax=Actinokineospora pegani TaxID=2654637 RepID=UPI0012EACC67|nr:glycosyltransferase family A protein [Actinokineospora pegani]
MTAPLHDRNTLSAATRRALRDAFGLWPMHEAVNRVRLGPKVPALRRFEDAEVARLAPAVSPSSLVTTIIPTYRRPDLLPLAIESALAQTITDNHVVVVDDGGGLPELPAHPRLSAVSLSRNCGVLGLVRNVGIRLSTSKYLAFLDDDNTWRPDHLELSLAALASGADFTYTALDRRHPDGTRLDILSEPFDRTRFADDTPFVDSNAIVLRRTPDALFSRLPRTRDTLPKEDWEFVHRLTRTRVVTHVPEPTVRYLVNTSSYYTTWKKD